MASFAEEFDTETLIEQVKVHPEIWNIKSEYNKDRRKRDCAWEEIAVYMVENFQDKGHKEKSDIVKKLAMKWRNIRDTFAKSEKKRKFLDKPTVKRRRYMYAKKLSFLQSCIDWTASRPSMPTYELHTLDEPEYSIVEEIEQPPCTSTSTSTSMLEMNTTSTTTGYSREEFESPLLKFLNQHMLSAPPDEHQSFFNSLLPAVRDLNDDQKLEFRTEVLHALKKVKQSSGNHLQTPGFHIKQEGELIIKMDPDVPDQSNSW